jgi:3-deoxy-manno-octulosonate cytidylyltransferase (CMP-KDO synthetase)
MKNLVIVIPCRLNSKRLSKKLIRKVAGKEIFLHTYKRCCLAISKKNIFIATDSSKIINICKKNKINVIKTSSKNLTGSDRIYEFSKKVKAKNYINVQGDEPMCNPEDIKKIVKYAKKFPKVIVNGFTEIKEKKSFYSPNIPKVVFGNNENLLYMSRAPIPFNKKKEFIKAWRQVCIYSFPHDSLIAYTSVKKKTLLESIEDLESNRFIELGYKIKMLKMSNKSIAVDTKEDLLKVRRLIKK